MRDAEAREPVSRDDGGSDAARPVPRPGLPVRSRLEAWFPAVLRDRLGSIQMRSQTSVANHIFDCIFRYSKSEAQGKGGSGTVMGSPEHSSPRIREIMVAGGRPVTMGASFDVV